MSSDDLTKQTPTPDRLDELISLVHGIAARLANLEQKFDSLDQRLGNLEQKVEERLHDTRPIWETVQAQITDLRESVQTQIAELRTEMTNNFQKVNRKFDVLSR